MVPIPAERILEDERKSKRFLVCLFLSRRGKFVLTEKLMTQWTMPKPLAAGFCR
jgi:hypothetical protein